MRWVYVGSCLNCLELESDCFPKKFGECRTEVVAVGVFCRIDKPAQVLGMLRLDSHSDPCCILCPKPLLCSSSEGFEIDGVPNIHHHSHV